METAKTDLVEYFVEVHFDDGSMVKVREATTTDWWEEYQKDQMGDWAPGSEGFDSLLEHWGQSDKYADMLTALSGGFGGSQRSIVEVRMCPVR